MPRLPGREPTRKVIDIEHALISSFVFPWEDRVHNKPCCIRGCDHKGGGECSRQSAGMVIDERKGDDHPDPYVGVACPHHVDEVIAHKESGGTQA